ncbi:MAG TPA: amidase family protein, partial [Aestuariivirga sp.]|nr:amidase family protein [Aestuariivirga sp.]
MSSLTELPLTAIAARIADGSVSAEAVTAGCLDRIERLDAGINAFQAVSAERALEQARAADTLRKTGRPLPLLHGVPLAHKDMFYRQGEESTCGSIIRRGWTAPATADVLRR